MSLTPDSQFVGGDNGRPHWRFPRFRFAVVFDPCWNSVIPLLGSVRVFRSGYGFNKQQLDGFNWPVVNRVE